MATETNTQAAPKLLSLTPKAIAHVKKNGSRLHLIVTRIRRCGSVTSTVGSALARRSEVGSGLGNGRSSRALKPSEAGASGKSRYGYAVRGYVASPERTSSVSAQILWPVAHSSSVLEGRPRG